MQSANVGDPQSYAAGIYPTSRENWAHNFQTYRAPVHHLQTNDPGSTNFWSGYTISATNGITVSTSSPKYSATVTCNQDCSWLAGQEIYISGNSNPGLNGTWLVSCSGVQGACPTDTLVFNTSDSALSGVSGNSGTVWAPDYWPIVLPFATLEGATSIEVWECSLDYAFNTQTTTWVTTIGSTGCAAPPWGTSPPGTGLTGGDLSYQNPLADSQNGQPSATHTLTGMQSTGIVSSR